MTSDGDDYLDSLREEARKLRYEPDSDVGWDRLASRIQSRIELPAPSVLSILAGWFRFSLVPIAVALVAAGWMATSNLDPLSVDPLGAIGESSLAVEGLFLDE